MNPIDALFARLRSQGRKAFIPFLTAGDPDLAATARLARILADHGGDLLEIGFAYSDPIADGPVIQASYTRALDRGVRVDDIFAAVRQFAVNDTPLAAMVSYSVIHRRGPQAFLDQAVAAGFSGAIVPDLPFEESEALSRLSAARDFKLIHLVTPTTPRDRARDIARRSTGFLYCVSVTGITGERDRLPAELLDQLAWLRRQTDLPLCVGFGISRPEQVRTLREVADGVIVGSAFVRHLEKAGSQSLDAIAAAIGDLAHSLADALNPPSVETEHKCPTCGKPMLERMGKRGPFLGCSGYPECKTIMNFGPDGQPVLSAVPTQHICEKCGQPMVIRQGKRGPFLGCTGYPKCKNAKDVDAEGNPIQPIDTGIACEKCGSPMTIKKGFRGTFLGCTGYPKCKNAKPIPPEM